MNVRRAEIDPTFLLVLAVLLLLIGVLGTIDLAMDYSLRGPTHLTLEVLFLLLCFVAALVLGVGWNRTRRGLTRTRTALDETRTALDRVRTSLDRNQAERDAWRQRAQRLLRGLGEAIDHQMREWSLTGAERETALLILKGYTHKEIASLTDRSERTVRQHAVAVYRKSGLGGRAELSAFFLEDLLLPLSERGEEATARTPPPSGS